MPAERNKLILKGKKGNNGRAKVPVLEEIWGDETKGTKAAFNVNQENDMRDVQAFKPHRHWLKSQTNSYFLGEMLLTNPKSHSQPLPLCHLHQKASPCPQSWPHDLVWAHEVRDVEEIPPDLISTPRLFLLWVWAWCLQLGQHPHNHDKNTKGIPEVSPDFTVSLESPPAVPISRCLVLRPQ